MSPAVHNKRPAKIAVSPSGAVSLPAYQRILGTIRQRIEQGELRCGDLVESERDLARRHKVSLMTARHALTELQREGLVERRRGAGTFVAPPKIQFNKLTSFTEQMAGRSLLPQSRLLSTKVIEDEQEIAARLALPPGSPLLVIERMRQAAGEPFALETCYFSAKDFSWLTRASLERTSLFALLERDYGAELSYSDESIDATVADGKLAKLLQIARGAPLLRICQIIFSSRGTAITYVRSIYRSDRHTVRIRRTR